MKNRKILVKGICITIIVMCISGNVSATEKISAVEVQELSRKEILEAKQADFEEGTLVKWKDYVATKQKKVHDGIIPINLLEDEVYCSMNFPSESRSVEMIRMYRDNGNVMGTMTQEHSTLTGMGALYKTEGVELPEEFTLCLGKIKTFVYLKSINNWVIIDEQPYPAGVYLYKMPWTEHSRKKCNSIKKYSDHMEIEMTNDEFENYALHFWGKKTSVDQNDVLYVACAYDFWIKEAKCDGCFTATIGIDAKDAKGSDSSTVQLFYSRGLEVTSEKKTHWGQTIPNNEYDSIWDGYVLSFLYDKWWNISN